MIGSNWSSQHPCGGSLSFFAMCSRLPDANGLCRSQIILSSTIAAGCPPKRASFARRGRGPAVRGHRQAFGLVSALLPRPACRDAPRRTSLDPVARCRFRQQHGANSQDQEYASTSHSADANGAKDASGPTPTRQEGVPGHSERNTAGLGAASGANGFATPEDHMERQPKTQCRRTR